MPQQTSPWKGCNRVCNSPNKHHWELALEQDWDNSLYLAQWLSPRVCARLMIEIINFVLRQVVTIMLWYQSNNELSHKALGHEHMGMVCAWLLYSVVACQTLYQLLSSVSSKLLSLSRMYQSTTRFARIQVALNSNQERIGFIRDNFEFELQ